MNRNSDVWMVCIFFFVERIEYSYGIYINYSVSIPSN